MKTAVKKTKGERLGWESVRTASKRRGRASMDSVNFVTSEELEKLRGPKTSTLNFLIP